MDVSQCNAHKPSASDMVGAYVLVEPDALNSLTERLHQDGVRLAIFSDTSNVFKDELDRLFPGFDAIVLREDVEGRKPDPNGIELILEKLGMSKGLDVWVIGDDLKDLAAARVAGCQPIGFNRKNVFLNDIPGHVENGVIRVVQVVLRERPSIDEQDMTPMQRVVFLDTMEELAAAYEAVAQQPQVVTGNVHPIRRENPYGAGCDVAGLT